MQIIKNYVFTCVALDMVLSSKYKLRQYYYNRGEYMSDQDLTKLINKKAFGKFTYMGDTWYFKTLFVDKKTTKITERKSAETVVKKPYTKLVGNFLITYSGHTNKPIMTSFNSHQK